MADKIKDNALFHSMSIEEIEYLLECSKSQVKKYPKNTKVFSQEDPPKSLYILIEGSIVVCRDSLNGRRYIVTNIEENEMFGEVYVFLENEEYPYYALATVDSYILEIPKSFFFHYCSKECNGHNLMIRNMLKILAQKAFFLNNKVQLLSHGSLRQKIAKYILEQLDESMYVKLYMNREEFADYLSVARPSLSRELNKMQKDGLIEVDKDIVRVINYDSLLDCVEGMEV
ncbi:MAG: Crp/Fnr family transcriptional regulator [Clostridiales bacterium]|nr:Crp/Fnr family transcriptional regulator [Clostridiales bacterium]